MDQEERQALEEALEQIEAIGFFAAIGMRFAESTPLLSEDVGDQVRGAPWESFSSTDRCFKMIHQLAIAIWHNLEELAVLSKREITDAVEKPAATEDVTPDIVEPEEAPAVTEHPSYCQRIASELRFLKTMGESIVSIGGEDKQPQDLDHERLKSLGEMVINTANTIIGKLQGLRDKAVKEDTGGDGPEKRPGRPLELIRGEMNGVKAVGSSLVAMAMASGDGFKLNPLQIETMGKMVADLADKVTEKLTRADQPQLTLVSG